MFCYGTTAAKFAGGLDIASLSFNKVDCGNFSLGCAINMRMDYRPSVHKDMLEVAVTGRYGYSVCIGLLGFWRESRQNHVDIKLFREAVLFNH